MFDPTLEYDVRRNFFIKYSLESPEVFSTMLNLQKKGKEKVKETINLFEEQAKPEQKEEGTKILCLKC